MIIIIIIHLGMRDKPLYIYIHTNTSVNIFPYLCKEVMDHSKMRDFPECT